MLEGLNRQQRIAVVADGNILLTACPGSGKTRVLTYKVAYELQKIEESKRKIVALTFTNRAADEIKRRLIRMDIDFTKLWAGTIHSFCLEWILRPYGCYLDELKNGYVIADEYKSEELISSLKEDYDLKGWERITTRLLTDGSFAEVKTQYHNLLVDYHVSLKDKKLIDFDQILYYAFKILNSYPKIGKTLNNLFHLICVDEYQDTQQLQYAILSKIITSVNGKTLLFLVGDKDQAIYGSLGGIAKSVEEISTEFGNLDIKEMELSGNYRSSQRIIDYYRNYQSTDIDIESLSLFAKEHGSITFSNNINKDLLDQHIASIIQENIDNGIPEHEICVLAPQWWLVIPIGRKLKKLLPNINFDAVGLSPLLKNRENIWFKIARLFLVVPEPKMYFVRNRWAAELLDELKNMGIKNFDSIAIHPKSLLRVVNSITSNSEDGLTYLEECFKKFLFILQVEISEHPLLEQHWEYFFEGSKKRLANPDFDYAKDIASFKRLFSHNSGVVVNTCHGIKGEEFHTVIAFGLLHGYIPNWNEDDAINASRKLLYVICSRSKKHLHLVSETGRLTQSGRSYVTTEHLKRLSYSYD
ncbi:MAG TPA: ATP-dependent helicase [Ferruginibacter sp.]|nr:ATP-dependent helicase [Ferruginibacter sp.]